MLIGNSDLQCAVDIQDGNGQYVTLSMFSSLILSCVLTLFSVVAFRTPLMLSVLSGHTDCVYSMLNKGASVEAKDKWGRTALHRGVRRSLCSTFTIDRALRIFPVFLLIFSYVAVLC